ncbi:hypothetical protein I79_014121 [Cricetulus griseus]|uniref:Uncharacterized protein n=1 Tax=Cricetulus griseus TaxID=10029 RepID=G3HTA0_CRIGR|nr:hypothetical protein I79_014121 [Cricetulus griseus]
MCMGVLPICLHHRYAWCPRKPEEDIGTPKLELQMVVSYYIGVGDCTQSSAEARSSLKC